MPLTRDEDIARLLGDARTIAVVGASDERGRWLDLVDGCYGCSLLLPEFSGSQPWRG
jgi:hypothetical protein